MKKINWFQRLGILLIACSLALALTAFARTAWAQKRMDQIKQQIQAVLPPETPGIVDPTVAQDMPVLEIRGRDYVGLLELPTYGIALPIQNSWSTLRAGICPSRYSGSVYDGTLVIGGTDRAGQLDFVQRLELGDGVEFTDMTGACFRYTVQWIQRSRTLDPSLLQDDGAQLILFVRDQFSLEYIIVRCGGA